MYIFEGRGKGATWSLLLEALHNQGVVIVPDSGNADFIRNHTIKQLEDQKLISSIGVKDIEILALGNDDEQVIDPFQRRERYNSFVMEQKREDINEELHKRWRNT